MSPATMSPSLKYLIVLSMAARKSSLEPMSLTATCGEVTVGLGILLGCSGQVGVVGTVLVAHANEPRATCRGYSTAHTLAKLRPIASSVHSWRKTRRRNFATAARSRLMGGGVPAASVADRYLQRHVKRV